jgi:diguanylate cyclase (GGDEF)-like protein/PAS domain S-box-containing protein
MDQQDVISAVNFPGNNPNHLLEHAIQQIGNPIVIIDTMDRIVWANNAFTSYSGFSIDETASAAVNAVFEFANGIGSYKHVPVSPTDADATWTRQLRVKTAGGRSRYAQEIVSVLRDGAGDVTHYVSVLHDMEQAGDAVHTEILRAGRDPLTGLPGRSQILQALDRGLHGAKKDASLLAVIFLDLDGFKQINDVYGHLAGDAVLQAVSARLTGAVRNSDSVGRFGGDEFVIVLPALSGRAAAREIGRKLVEQMAHPFAMKSGFHYIGASVGVAFSPEHGSDASTLLAHADAAMYAAKRNGGGRLAIFRNASASSPCPRFREELPALLTPGAGSSWHPPANPGAPEH